MSDSRATLERAESELVALRKLAAELARDRRERVTTVHLLAAMSSRPGPVADLLDERRLGAEALLKAGRSFDEDDGDAIHRATVQAKDIAHRARAANPPSVDVKPVAPEPSGVHVFLALLADRRSAAHRALLQCGVDMQRLRTAAVQISIGFVSPRRAPSLAFGRGALPNARASVPHRARFFVAPAPPIEAAPQRRAVLPIDSKRPSTLADPTSTRAVIVPLMKPSTRPPPPSEARPSGDAAPKSDPPVAPATPTRAPKAPRVAHRQRARTEAHRNEPAAREGEATVAEASRVVLPTVTRDLSVLAAEGAFDHLVGRDEELERALDVLGRETANVACFVGRIGAGTTSAALALSTRLLEEGCATHELLLPMLAKNPGVRAHLAALRTELANDPSGVALVLDEVLELVVLGDDIAQELRLLLAIPGLRVITTASPDQLKRLFELAPAVARQLSPIEIDEPDAEEAFVMVRARAKLLSRHHGLRYSDEAIAAAIGWSKRYMSGRALPEKALSALDLAGARAKRRATVEGEIDPAIVAEVISEQADVPVDRLLQKDRDRMIALEAEIAKHVIGHTNPIARISARIRQNAAGLAGDRPIGSFLLLGPTGVGKTETAKAIARVLFGAPTAMTRIDMSEYAEGHAVARLIGAPPGYVGHEAGGQLTEAVRQRPYQVVLLDEIEKAHRDVLEAFLQVLDEGHLTDGRGRRVDFKNTVLVLTSNLGAREVEAERTKRSVGFSSDASVPREKLESTSIQAARRELPPELFNRLDEVMFFAPLERVDVAQIARMLLGELESRLSQRGVALDVQAGAIDALLDQGGFDPSLGARPMRRAIARLIEAPLADLALRGELDDGRVALVHVEDGVISVDAVDAAVKPARTDRR